MRKLTIILFTLPLLCYAQFEASMFTTNNQKLIEQAVQNGFVIVEQTYQLEDPVTHQRFGRYGNEIFGKTRVLGIRVNKSIVVAQSMLSPWEQDENFTRYKDSYIPVLWSTSVTKLNDTTSISITPQIDSMNVVSQSLIMIPDSTENLRGFQYQRYNQPTEGWLVWVMSDKSITECDGTPQILSIYKKMIEFEATPKLYEVDIPQTGNMVWGGVFIIPEQTEIGQLTFKLGGILSPSNDSKWNLELFSASIPEEIEPKRDELTPLTETPAKKKNKKNKK